jgi:hypothetical protein
MTWSDAQVLSQEEIARAIELGQRCTAPIVRIAATRGEDFDVYIESPQARAALVVATAMLMHQPLDAAPVRRAMQEPGYRVWGDYVEGSLRTVTVGRIGLRPAAGSEIVAGDQRYERLFVGRAPSHGIIEPLRARFGEAVFDSLPSGDFDVLFHTTAGTERYHVSDKDRATLLHVCND